MCGGGGGGGGKERGPSFLKEKNAPLEANIFETFYDLLSIQTFLTYVSIACERACEGGNNTNMNEYRRSFRNS